MNRARWTLVGLVVASTALRIAYFIQIDGSPCSQWHRWEDGDPNFFDQWGRRIAAGDWLTDASFHPLHTWHKRVAKEYYYRNRQEEARLIAEGKDPARTAWDRWYGGRLYHQEPLYPFLIGVTYRLFDPDPRFVYAWQLALGVLSNVLIWWLTRRYFGERAGLIAGAIAVFCGPLLFYEMTLVRTSLTVFFTLALVAVFDRAFEARKPAWWALAGLTLGLSLLLQTIFVLFGVAALGLLMWRHRDREGLKAAAAVTAAALVAMSPAFIRNAMVGAPLTGLSSVGTVTFVAANWPDTDPTRGWAVDEAAMARLLTDTGGDFTGAIAATLDQHSPWSFAQLTVRKLKMLFHNYELPNNKNILFYREYAPVIGITFIGFGLILPLALFGLYASWKQVPRPTLLYSIAITSTVPMLIFYVLARFRAPLAAVLIPFAAFGALRLAEWIQAREWKRVMIAGGGALLILAVMFRPLPAHMRPIRSMDYRVAFRTSSMAKERTAVDRQDWKAAEQVLSETLAIEPEEVRRLDGTPLSESGFEIRQITDFFRAVHNRRGDYLRKLGRPEDAKKDEERGAVLQRSLGGMPSAPDAP